MSATTIGNETALARSASQRAYTSNTAAAHKSAAESHHRAANAAFARNDLRQAKQHKAIAQKHTLKAVELGKQEKATAKKGGRDNIPDEPTQTNADPLLTQRGGFR
jgi:hypothetical protein